MKHLFFFRFALLLAAILPLFEISAQTTATNDRWDLNRYVWSHGQPGTGKVGKPMLDFSALDNWPCITTEAPAVSHDGKYIAYGVQNLNNNRLDSIVVQSVNGSWRQVLTGKIKPGFFSGNGKQYIYSDKEGLCFLETGSAERQSVKEVASFLTPGDKRYKWLAMLLKDSAKTVVLRNLLTGREKSFSGISDYKFDNSNQWLFCHLLNKKLLLVELTTGKELLYEGVESFVQDKGGMVLLLTCHNAKGGTSLEYVRLTDHMQNTLWHGVNDKHSLGAISINKPCSQVVFVVRKKTMSAADSSLTVSDEVWNWKAGDADAKLLVDCKTAGIEAGLSIVNIPGFYDNDRYIRLLLQGASPMPVKPLAGSVQVDVWGFKDKVLQVTQAFIKEQEPQESVLYDLQKGELLRPERGYEKLVGDIRGGYAFLNKKGKEGNGDRFWEKGYNGDSTWLISLETGVRRLLPTKKMGDMRFSPDGHYVVYFDAIRGCNYFSYNLASGNEINISSRVPLWQLGYKPFNLRSTKRPESTSGINMWVADNHHILVKDEYDIWELDITGRQAALNLTNGYGRLHQIKFNLLLNDPNNGVDRGCVAGDTLFLSAFNMATKYQGFYRKVLGMRGNPECLSMDPCYMTNVTSGSYILPMKVKEDGLWVVLRESATDAPNYFLTKDLKKFTAATDIKPQRKYNWFTTELHSFTQLDGTKSQGVLYKPENFDATKVYPVIVSFYGDLSDRMYQYPSSEYYLQDPSIYANPSWMVSHGYLVFIPDIYFEEGKWGPSTVNTLDGAARYLRSLPYVDGKHMGAACHSNSGRFGYYLLTHSKSFTAMSIGAGTTNLISVALSIKNRDQSSRLEWVENTSYGTGIGNLWNNKTSWLDHASVLNANKVTSPVLMFHNKSDDALGPGQAIEMFIALRRLEKAAWWLQFDKGGHQVGGNDSRDFTIRFTQFFDHYLKGAPAPTWMTKGIDFKDKGVITGYDLDPSGSCKKECAVCKQWNERYRKTPAMFSKGVAEWRLQKEMGETAHKTSTTVKTK